MPRTVRVPNAIKKVAAKSRTARGLTRAEKDMTEHPGIEIADDQSLEMPAAHDFNKQSNDEAFMAEIVVIEVAETVDENARPYVDLSVNGVTMPIRRGVRTSVKRKFVEALARCKETKYRQVQESASDPDKQTMVPSTALVYPFNIVKDTPIGRRWCAAVMAEPA